MIDNLNKLIRSSVSGEVHSFNENMTKEEIHNKLDELFDCNNFVEIDIDSIEYSINSGFNDIPLGSNSEEINQILTEEDLFELVPNLETIQAMKEIEDGKAIKVNYHILKELDDLCIDIEEIEWHKKRHEELLAKFKKRHPNGAKIDTNIYEKFLKIGEKLK